MSYLPVRVVTATRSRHVTAYATGLTFTKNAPGGHTSARVRLSLPLDEWADLVTNSRFYIYDPATGLPLFDGYVSNPTPNRGGNGNAFELSADGGRILAADDRRTLVYLDRDQEGWVRSPVATVVQSARTEFAPAPGADDTPGMLLGFSPGQPLGTGHRAAMRYTPLMPTDAMEAGAIASDYVGGVTSADYALELAWDGPVPGPGSTDVDTLSTTPDTMEYKAGGGTLPDGSRKLALALKRTGGATNVVDDDHWLHHANLRVLGRRMDRFGSLLSAADLTTTDYVLASWVIEDLIGRMMPFVDAGAALVYPSTTEIAQLAYRTPVTALTVFEALTLHEPDMLWEVLESVNDGHRFNFRPWPTEVRYLLSYADGWQARGTDVDLCNRVWVNWTDVDGRPTAVLVSAEVPSLGNRVRHADPINLPTGLGSEANAQAIGAEVLAANAELAESATMVVRRRVFDRLTGRWVYPYQIEPGYLAIVREPGTTLRVTEVTYDDDAQAATLTLGQPQLTLDQRLARLAYVA